MLTQWRIKNFKAWQDTGPIKLAPLTVIFGENSVGKSSLGQLLQALKHSTISSEVEQPLGLSDAQSALDLGSFTQYLHQGCLAEPLAFELQWHVPDTLLLDDVGQQNSVAADTLRLQVSAIADDNQQLQLQTMQYIVSAQGQEIVAVSYTHTQRDTLLVHIKKPQACTYNIALEDALRPEQFYRWPVSQSLGAGFIAALAQQAEKVFEGCHALAALRAAPQRRYHWAGERPVSVGDTGEFTVAALLAADADHRRLQFSSDQPELPFVEGVAYWLKQLGVATEFSIQPVSASATEYQLMFKTHAETREVCLADMGFGVSQLLPVLVQAFYAQPHSTLWLQQPETHLHSQVQAGLADMLIAAAHARENGQARNVQIVVESHSEHFLNRLQRRIAEGVISHEDVALYFCSREGTQAKIEALSVDTYGEIANWPEHLFGDEMTDIAARALAALQRKRQTENGADDA